MKSQSLDRYGAFEGKKDALVKDLKAVVADADGLLKEVASSTAGEFAAARTKLEGGLGNALTRIDAARIAVAEKAKYATDASHDYVRDNPWKVLGVTAAAALIAGVLLSRR